MPVNDGQFKGWPFQNYAMELRGTQVPYGARGSTIVYPRRKYTYIVEFQINPAARVGTQMQTNLNEFLQNGRIYTSLKSIDHPKVGLTTETLRSYNKYVKVPVKTEFQPAAMSFHDDNASLAIALWKEYLAFYSYAGDVGRGVLTSGNPQQNQNNAFRIGNDLVGPEVRSDMDTRPSVGITLRPNNMRHFFDSIVIYDLGSEPDSVNVYYFVNPSITNFDHEALDYFDREGQTEINMTFEYENYYFVLGQNAARFRDVIESVLGYFPFSDPPRVEGHARMLVPSRNISRPAGNNSNLEPPINENISGASEQGPSPIGAAPTTPVETQPLDSLEGETGFVLPENIQETQARLDQVGKLLDNPDLIPGSQTGVGAVGRNQAIRELQLYEAQLTEHLNNQSRELSALGSAFNPPGQIPNSGTEQVRTRTEDTRFPGTPPFDEFVSAPASQPGAVTSTRDATNLTKDRYAIQQPPRNPVNDIVNPGNIARREQLEIDRSRLERQRNIAFDLARQYSRDVAELSRQGAKTAEWFEAREQQLEWRRTVSELNEEIQGIDAQLQP